MTGEEEDKTPQPEPEHVHMYLDQRNDWGEVIGKICSCGAIAAS